MIAHQQQPNSAAAVGSVASQQVVVGHNRVAHNSNHHQHAVYMHQNQLVGEEISSPPYYAPVESHELATGYPPQVARIERYEQHQTPQPVERLNQIPNSYNQQYVNPNEQQIRPNQQQQQLPQLQQQQQHHHSQANYQFDAPVQQVIPQRPAQMRQPNMQSARAPPYLAPGGPIAPGANANANVTMGINVNPMSANQSHQTQPVRSNAARANQLQQQPMQQQQQQPQHQNQQQYLRQHRDPQIAPNQLLVTNHMAAAQSQPAAPNVIYQHHHQSNGNSGYNQTQFVEQHNEQYPSNSPTLLQQQLNRQRVPPAPMQQQQVRSNYLPSNGPNVQKARVFEPEPIMGEPQYIDQQVTMQQQQVPSQQHNSRPNYYPSRGYQANQIPSQTQVGPAPRAPMNPRLTHHHQQQQPQSQHQVDQQHPSHLVHQNQNHMHQHQSPHLIVGNPTPPLTPINLPSQQQHQQQQHQQQANSRAQWHSHVGAQSGDQHIQLNNYQKQPIAQNSHHLQPQMEHRPAKMPIAAGQPYNFQHHGPSNGGNFTNAANSSHHMPQTSQQVSVMAHQRSAPPNADQGGQMVANRMMPNSQIQQAADHQQPNQIRLTLPLRDGPLLGPFKLEHDVQVSSKVFQINQQLFEALSKSKNMPNPHLAAVTQEIQFRAYIVKGQPHQSAQGDSLLAQNNLNSDSRSRVCNWPEFFQLSVNQNIVPIRRTKGIAHSAVDIFQFCRIGDNVIEIQVNDCYCSHEFVLEAVDRPTLKAFISSCFKSRLLAPDDCIGKMKCNFGSSGFLMPYQLQIPGIINEYINEYHQGIEQTKTRISMRCPISVQRMRTPSRGHHCKHLQCFDLENFLSLNSEKSHWFCPICQGPIPFTMLELDQHQINIIQRMVDVFDTDDIIMDSEGRWQAYYSNNSPVVGPNHHQQSLPIQNGPPQIGTAKPLATFHPQPQAMMNSPTPIVQSGRSSNSPIRPMGTNQMVTSSRGMPVNHQMSSPGGWDMMPHEQQVQNQVHSVAVRRPASAINQPNHSPATGCRSANGSPLSKKPHLAPQSNNQFNGPNGHQVPTIGNYPEPSADLMESPLAAIERTVIQHEQQMGPPPFDPSTLAPSPHTSQRGTNNMASNTPVNSSSSQPNANSQMSQPGVDKTRHMNSNNVAFSPVAAQSPVTSRVVPASPQQQHQVLPQSPMQHQQAQQQQPVQSSISTPATPSSSSGHIHGGPETPATPSNSGCQSQQPNFTHCNPSSISQSPHVGTVGVPSHQMSGVDHQPLSNGSASVGSITSSSTMTPSGQSLGSVGMGSDSRCGTAPLQGSNALAMDELIVAGASNSNQSPYNKQSSSSNNRLLSSQSDEKNDILMGKLMMDSNESIMRDHRNGDFVTAIQEAEWKQQLDRGKSEHLANFLNDPSMKKHQQQHYQDKLHKKQPHQVHNSDMLSGGLNPSDEDDHSNDSSPGQNLDQLSEFANFMDPDEAGAGLPPDDSILDLFER